MFKRFNRLATPEPSCSIFADTYWRWYIDSYEVNDKQTLMKHTPYNKLKYTEKSADVITLKSYFQENKLPVPSSLQIIALLKSPFTQGDLNRTYYLIRMFQTSSQGLFLTNSRYDKLNHTIHFLGAENWDNVMCYLDALLFSMFANLESFEPILFLPNHSDYLLNQLLALLRVYVNLLRSGNLITTDITAKICEALMKLGFKEALSHRQQDAATLFEFLTSTLNMPLLTFKIDIKHGGKYNKQDDEKISRERILFVSIPNEEEEDEILQIADKGSVSHDENAYTSSDSVDSAAEDLVLLEECLEHYFNNSISVKRELERRATLSNITEDVASLSTSADDGKPRIVDTPMSGKYDVETIDNINEKIRSRNNSFKNDGVRVGLRERSSTLSIWSQSENGSGRSRRGSTGKEVSLPAWMFLRLLPFYTDDNLMTDNYESIVKTSKEFAIRRPILPICLKRYRFNSGASAGTRSKKRIIIPPFIDLPEFVADDIDSSIGSFRLILESAICHRGDTIELGHFVSVVRKHTNILDETEEEANAAHWYLYDDMHKKARVVEKSFKEIFKTEWPYMLFYRLVTTEDISSASSINSAVAPPPQGSNSSYWKDSGSGGASSGKSNKESIPILRRPPSDAKYRDVREKYYWYLMDDHKNYFKEEPAIVKDGNSNITLSPQYRRNSQWSNNSRISAINLEKDSPAKSAIPARISSEERLTGSSNFTTTAAGDNSSNSSFWKKTMKAAAPSVGLNSSDSLGEIHKLVSPENKKGALPKTLRNLEDQQRKHHHVHHPFHKKAHKRDEYKKEHCLIM
ncbi:hypothetical protein Cantr_10674 [Candida viswanathii]|uniref:ubiquitinyl hydrolase 1 n=1 Tax=Candida viswanathii TaxID=5486 RepID=A0A367YDU6_9ASCO|nr:hypothetical protein Cantr_10674 [Candida viswanathii]